MFEDRKEAGRALGSALKKYQSAKPVVLAIPRGGVEVGYFAALTLGCDFDIIITRKLCYPQQPEAAFGVIAEDGSLYFDPWSNKYLTKDIIIKVQTKEKKEIQRRVLQYRNGEDLPSLKGRVVILVDDGIATGATMFGAIRMCCKHHPEKIVIAAPVSGLTRLSKLETEADEVLILNKYQHLAAVSQGYCNFTDLTDEDVQLYLKKQLSGTTKLF
ncbi:phosphoribosyltransferase [Aliifodinibius sp. S!AR15-10]|uniref:phosphoribosyltransferase n=1 Tax=Aliifodinibius sp. S!AR15-10 TaxID=2950437 RepID=UPI00285C8B01|nr:phosphoribosyltransferase family protein [Aliifodinibius sp. S!AR15-10]MDR8390446.1 phosphoribosyltransferase [Aliifodinibius sp. S!AR15-10]